MILAVYAPCQTHAFEKRCSARGPVAKPRPLQLGSYGSKKQYCKVRTLLITASISPLCKTHN